MKIIKICFDVDNNYDKIHQHFKNTSVIISYVHSFVPPNKVKYFIGPLTDLGIENWIKDLNNLGVEYKLYEAEWTEKLRDFFVDNFL